MNKLDDAFPFAGKLLNEFFLAMSEGRRFYYRTISLLLKDSPELNREVTAKLCMTKGAKEGVGTFRRKRTPYCKDKQGQFPIR